MNQQQEVARQTARNEEIMSFWRSNVGFAIQGARGQADSASDAGFQLAGQLYQDIRNPIVLVSRTACDRLLELVRFCFSYAFGVRDTTWPKCRNGIWARSRPLPPSRWSPAEERNWMVKRGLNLVYDLQRFLRLHCQVLNRMRQFSVDSLHFVSGLCHEQGIAALHAFRGDANRRFWWQKKGDRVLRFLGGLVRSPDRVLRDAGFDALRDRVLRMRIRKAVRDRMLQEEEEEANANPWARGSIFIQH